MTVTLEAIEKKLNEVSGAMNTLSLELGKQSTEIKSTGETSASTAAAITKAEAALEELSTEAKEMHVELTKAMSEAKSAHERVDVLEKELARPNQRGAARELLSDMFLKSSTFEGWQQSGAQNSGNFSQRGTFFGAIGAEGSGFFQKNAITQFDSNGEPLGGRFQLLDVYADPLLPRTLSEIIPTGVTTQSVVEFPYETVRMPLRTRLASEAASGQKDLVVEITSGWKVGADLKIGNEKHKVAAINKSTKTLTLVDNLAATYPAETDVFGEYFTPTTENAQKPESGIIVDMRKENVETIASWMPITRQMSKDAPMVRAFIEGRLPEYVRQARERQIIYGDGSAAREMQGLMNHADAQSYKWSEGALGDTKLDAIRRAITLAVLAGYPVDTVVLNPLDWQDLELLKADDKQYVRVQLYDAMGRPMVWRVQVVESTHIKEGDFLVAALRMAVQLWVNEEVNLRITDSHGDLFIKNTLVLLAEERICQTVFRPQSLVQGQFDHAPAAA